MPSKRFHSKSRHGCIPCKNRRVKCNLERPICSNCARRNQVCTSIGSEHSLGLSASDLSTTATTSHSHRDEQQQRTRTPNELFHFGLISTARPINSDLYFLERYFSHTCPTLSSRPESQRSWAQTRANPDQSSEQAQHHYLTHLQIAISELHFSLTETDTALSSLERQKHWENSIDHQTAALSTMRPVLANSATTMQINGGPDEVRPLFSAAWLIFLFNLTFPRGKIASKVWIVDEIVELSELAKGVVAIISVAGAGIMPPTSVSASSENITTGSGVEDEYIKEAKAKVMIGPLRPFFIHFLPWKHEGVPASVRRQNLPSSAQHLFNTFEAMDFDNNNSENRKNLYRHAIEMVELTVIAIRINPQHPSIVFMWLIGTKREFMELVKQRDEIALRIFRVYGMTVKDVEGYWWARGLAKTIIEGADIALASLSTLVYSGI